MRVKQLVAAVLLSVVSITSWAQAKVAYHINDAQNNALGALRNIRNHLDTDPTAKVTVVTEGFGVDFLMDGAKDRNGGLFSGAVSALISRGVRFEVCEITLRLRDLKKDQFILEAEYTPSGVVRLTALQMQGHAYIKP